MTKQKWFSIDEAAQELHITSAWIRAAIRSGQLSSIKEPVSPGSLVMKHKIAEKALNEFANRENQRAPRREDKRSKWILYATPDEIKLLKELLYTQPDVHLQVVASTIQANAVKERYLSSLEE